MEKIKIQKGDITKIETDAIVNAANNSLLGGGGVDGAIHRAAGPALREECKTLEGCPTGGAKATKGYNLPAQYVIHAVGPVWKSLYPEKSEKLLASAYRRSLEVAVEIGARTLAFPNISTGIFGFPKQRAARIAIKEVKTFLQAHPELEQVVFVTFDEGNHSIYKNLL